MLVAIDGAFVGIDHRLGGGALSKETQQKEKAQQYVISILLQAVAKRRRAETSGSVPIVVLRRTGAGEAAYVTIEAPVHELSAADTSPYDCCGNAKIMDSKLGSIFAVVALTS